MKEIDVHGMLHSDAIIFIEDVVLEQSLKTNLFEVKVITGNSPRLQRRIKNQICKKLYYENKSTSTTREN